MLRFIIIAAMTASRKYLFIDKVLNDRKEQQRLRKLRPIEPLSEGKVAIAGETILNFSSNDYLGLSQHPLLIETAQTYLKRYGAGATASRLVTGNYEIHQQLEYEFAQFLNREASLLFTSGFQANSTLLPTLFDRSSLIFCDRLVHNSLVQGILASQATFIRYRHNDLTHLKKCLDQHYEKYQAGHYNRLGIVTETIFSMDGDRSNLETIVSLAEQYDTWLYLDDAHGLGVYGEQGEGLAAVYPRVDVTIGTLGKAFGSFGAIVGCSQRLKDYWINTCPGLIYTTALPPSVIGSVTAALSLMPTLKNDRERLFDRAKQLHQILQKFGYQTASEPSHILPLILGSPQLAIVLESYLQDHGILATAIRSPTVPVGSDRIRFALSSVHQAEDYDRLFRSLFDFQQKRGRTEFSGEFAVLTEKGLL